MQPLEPLPEASLLAAVWQQAKRDLERGRSDARAWLDSDHFRHWAEVSGADPEQARAHLLALWPASH